MKKPYTPTTTRLCWLFALMVTLTSLTARAQEKTTGWLVNSSHPPVAVRFMLTGQTNPTAKTVEGVLEVKLNDEWKTYWRTPGEGGIPPKIDWSHSSNLKQVDWHWPTPHRYEVFGVEILGYKHDTVFPMTLHIEDMNNPVGLEASLTLSTCTTVCVLTQYAIALEFSPDKLTSSPDTIHLYNQSISHVPSPHTSVTLEKASWDQKTNTVSLTLNNPNGWKSPDIFVDTSEDNFNETTFSAPDIRLNGNELTATINASSWLDEPNLLNKTLSLVISDQDLAAALQAPLSERPAKAENSLNIFIMLAIALLGGLILNIMPCVLPVLGMKLSTVLTAKGMQRHQIRRQFLASAAGILMSFWLLAGFLVFLKLSGQALGWGVQFQSLYFIGIMVLITALFAANMLGLFEIQLPSSASTWLATRGGDSLAGHFIQGMFATLLATPCSAPFLGTAVAFALGANIVTLLMIFTALAIGMASPWLLIAAVPKLATLLPKPSQRMNTVKLVFGFMMLGSSLWLLSLMKNHLGSMVTGIIAIIGLVLLMARLWQKKGRKPALITIASVFLSTAIVAAISQLSGKVLSPLSAELKWQPLDTTFIQKSVAQGHTVFVDVTAEWCITCKANKIGVLLQDPVYSRLQKDDIIRVKGDWTKPSEKVTAYLQAHGRYSVPFNIVYGPSAPEGIPLPVILTKDAVIQAISEASGKGATNGQ